MVIFPSKMVIFPLKMVKHLPFRGPLRPLRPRPARRVWAPRCAAHGSSTGATKGPRPKQGHAGHWSPLHLGKVHRNGRKTHRKHTYIYIIIYGYGSKPWYLVNPKIAGKWMFIPLKMVLIGIDPYPYIYITLARCWVKPVKNPDFPWVSLFGMSHLLNFRSLRSHRVHHVHHDSFLWQLHRCRDVLRHRARRAGRRPSRWNRWWWLWRPRTKVEDVEAVAGSGSASQHRSYGAREGPQALAPPC